MSCYSCLSMLPAALRKPLQTRQAIQHHAPRDDKASVAVPDVVVSERVVQAHNCTGGVVELQAFASFLNFPLNFLYIFEQGTINADHLEASLRRVLDHYPSLAGRLMNKGELLKNDNGDMVCGISLDNAGVIFKVVDNMKGSARDLQGWRTGPKNVDSYSLFPDLNQVTLGKGPMMTVQLTTFRDGGCTLGVTINHLVVDGWSYAMFMRDWSEIYNGRIIDPVNRVLPNQLVRGFTDEEANKYIKDNDLRFQMGGWKVKMMMKMFRLFMGRILRNPPTRSVIHFSDDELKALKTAAEQKAGTWVSTNEALMAHLHPIFMDIFGNSETAAASKDVYTAACVPVNLRGKVDGATERTVGNLVTVADLEWDSNAKAGAAKSVHDALRASLEQRSLQDNAKYLNWMLARMEFYKPRFYNGNTPKLGVIGQWNYQVSNPYYEIDFGAGAPDRSNPWSGEPVKVMRGLPREGGVDVFVAHSDDGIKAWMTETPLNISVPLPIRSYEGLNKSVGACLLLSCFMPVGCLAHISLGAPMLGLLHLVKKKKQDEIDRRWSLLEQHPKLKASSPTLVRQPRTMGGA